MSSTSSLLIQQPCMREACDQHLLHRGPPDPTLPSRLACTPTVAPQPLPLLPTTTSRKAPASVAEVARQKAVKNVILFRALTSGCRSRLLGRQ